MSKRTANVPSTRTRKASLPPYVARRFELFGDPELAQINLADCSMLAPGRVFEAKCCACNTSVLLSSNIVQCMLAGRNYRVADLPVDEKGFRIVLCFPCLENARRIIANGCGPISAWMLNEAWKRNLEDEFDDLVPHYYRQVLAEQGGQQ